MSDLKRMRIIATSALASMAGLYILARSLEHHALFWGYVAAFAEAAMVGALADWFAVVASGIRSVSPFPTRRSSRRTRSESARPWPPSW